MCPAEGRISIGHCINEDLLSLRQITPKKLALRGFLRRDTDVSSICVFTWTLELELAKVAVLTGKDPKVPSLQRRRFAADALPCPCSEAGWLPLPWPALPVLRSGVASPARSPARAPKRGGFPCQVPCPARAQKRDGFPCQLTAPALTAHPSAQCSVLKPQCSQPSAHSPSAHSPSAQCSALTAQCSALTAD